jgi:hypothetical protein
MRGAASSVRCGSDRREPCRPERYAEVLSGSQFHDVHRWNLVGACTSGRSTDRRCGPAGFHALHSGGLCAAYVCRREASAAQGMSIRCLAALLLTAWCR